jgi:hypothetical protein
MTTTKPAISIVRREIELDTDDLTFDTYGKVIDRLLTELPVNVIAVTVDLRTPSSASLPAILVTFRDTPIARQAIADFFYDDIDDLDFV